MTKREFLREHREQLDQYIREQTGRSGQTDTRLNDKERELWVLNDEHWYRLALRSGVRL